MFYNCSFGTPVAFLNNVPSGPLRPKAVVPIVGCKVIGFSLFHRGKFWTQPSAGAVAWGAGNEVLGLGLRNRCATSFHLVRRDRKEVGLTELSRGMQLRHYEYRVQQPRILLSGTCHRDHSYRHPITLPVTGGLSAPKYPATTVFTCTRVVWVSAIRDQQYTGLRCRGRSFS